jgi:hypothetical protein
VFSKGLGIREVQKMKNNPGSRWAIIIITLSVCLVVGLSDPAFAGPGGVFKAVAETFWGKVGLLALVVVFSPLLIWYYGRRYKHCKAVKKDLEALAAVYPQYRWLDVKDNATEIFTWVWSAWSQEKMSLASEHVTHWYRQNQQLLLDQWQRDGVENFCRLERITNIVPLYVEHKEGENGNGSRLVLEIDAVVVDYLKDRTSGKIVKGDTKSGDLETIWTLMWQDQKWKLNLIEDSSEEFSYLGLPSKLPEAIQQAETTAKQKAH